MGRLRAGVDAAARRAACTDGRIALSMRRSRDLVLTRRDAQRKVYVPVVGRSCLAGLRDDYRFPGFRGRL